MRTAIIIFCLLFLLTLSYWFLRGFRDDDGVSAADEQVENVFVAFDVKAKYYSSEGYLLYQVDSNEVTELSQDNGTVFNAPLVKSYNPEQVLEWQGNSGMALLSADKSKVLMHDNVRILQSPNTPNEIELIGDDLQYNADTAMIYSEQPVTISDGVFNQESNRFSLNIKTDKIEFENGVEANYQNEE